MIAQETGHLKPEWCESLNELSIVEVSSSTKFLDQDIALRVAIGLAWEDWYISTQLVPEGIMDHPGEYCVDGIYMSPDAEELSTIIVDKRPQHIIRVHEIKATGKSVNTVGETAEELKASCFMWLCQIMAYCKGAGTRFADLHVLFRYGDYVRPFMLPQKKRFRMEFTQEEIDGNWEMIRSYRDYRMDLEATQ